MRLITFLQHQRYLGLTVLDYNNILGRYVLKSSCISYFLYIVVQGILISCILATFFQWSLNYQKTDSISGDTFDHLVILAASFTQLFANAWMLLHQQSQLLLLQGLGRVVARLHFGNLEKLPSRWLYRLWVFMCLYYALDCVAFVIFDLNSQLDHLIFLLGFFVRLVCANFIITSYCSLVCLLKHLFRLQAAQLQHYLRGSFVPLFKVANNLRLNDELWLLCQQEMVDVYGGALVMPYLYATLDATEVCYLALPKDGFSLMEMLLLLRWMIPICIYISMPMLISDVADEANKTAKILAKIPRTGSGLDRMVQKFLLKNLRQQPILTAYGFFALDKSTLFKLFTAIFTYMVILVQFKEMENSTKSLQKT